MARLTRHQLKTDEFATRMEAISDFFLENRKRIMIWGVAAAVGIGLGLGVYVYIRSQQAKAASAFSEALSTYHTLVVEEPLTNPNVPTFKTAEEKYQAARQQFLEVSSQFQRWQAGQWARYYAALCLRELGQLTEAEAELAAVARESGAEAASLAKMALAEAYETSGREAEAETLYKELAAAPTATVPKPAAEIALAELYQKTNPAQATALYQQMEKDYPGTAAGDLAARMLQDTAE